MIPITVVILIALLGFAGGVIVGYIMSPQGSSAPVETGWMVRKPFRNARAMRRDLKRHVEPFSEVP